MSSLEYSDTEPATQDNEHSEAERDIIASLMGIKNDDNDIDKKDSEPIKTESEQVVKKPKEKKPRTQKQIDATIAMREKLKIKREMKKQENTSVSENKPVKEKTKVTKNTEDMKPDNEIVVEKPVVTESKPTAVRKPREPKPKVQKPVKEKSPEQPKTLVQQSIKSEPKMRFV